MNIMRIRQEVYAAVQQFAYVELHPSGDGGVYVKAALHTSAGRTYIVAIYFVNYPAAIPQVYVTAPSLHPSAPHTYGNGKLCLLHPVMMQRRLQPEIGNELPDELDGAKVGHFGRDAGDLQAARQPDAPINARLALRIEVHDVRQTDGISRPVMHVGES